MAASAVIFNFRRKLNELWRGIYSICCDSALPRAWYWRYIFDISWAILRGVFSPISVARMASHFCGNQK
jgi:hypothetical protein